MTEQKKEPVKCLICGEQTKYVVDSFSRYHLKPCHDGMTIQEYYDLTMKTEGEDVCSECGDPTTFMSVVRGYRPYCNKCFRTADSVKKKISASYGHRDLDAALEKRKATCVGRFGVEYAMQNDDLKNKLYEKNIALYGTHHTLGLDQVKDARLNALTTRAEEINDKRKLWWNHENTARTYANIRKSAQEMYGVDSVSQLPEVINKIRTTNESSGKWLTENDAGTFRRYWLDVRKETRKHIRQLMCMWDGKCCYTQIPIYEFLEKKQQHGFYPTVDHKVSVKQGFVDGIPSGVIGNIDNLCICCRSINSSKNSKDVEQFELIREERTEWLWTKYRSLKQTDTKS